MDVFNHHIYEYKKGLRTLVLYTSKVSEKSYIENKLRKHKISYIINDITDTKINVFFGKPVCIEVLKQMGNKPLNEYTPEEDFIIGTMLGYCPMKQCMRYINQKAIVEKRRTLKLIS